MDGSRGGSTGGMCNNERETVIAPCVGRTAAHARSDTEFLTKLVVIFPLSLHPGEGAAFAQVKTTLYPPNPVGCGPG